MGMAKYGSVTPLRQPAEPFTGISNGAVSTANMRGKFLHPDSPELWLFGIGALTLGFIAVSTSARVGPVHFSAGVGK